MNIKLKLPRELIQSNIRKNISKIKPIGYNDHGRLYKYSSEPFNKNDLEKLSFTSLPEKVTSHIKNNFSNIILMCVDDSIDGMISVNELFNIDFIKPKYIWHSSGKDVYDKIATLDKIEIKGKIELEDEANKDLINLFEYKIHSHYVHLCMDRDAPTNVDIFQLNETGDLILPEFDYIEMEIDRDRFIDSKETRQIFLDYN